MSHIGSQSSMRLKLCHNLLSGKPNMVLTPRGLYNATHGDELLFECKATGFPVPHVKWVLPTTDLLEFITLTSWPGYARIEMKAGLAVEGEYTCLASNIEGEMTDSIIVKGLLMRYLLCSDDKFRLAVVVNLIYSPIFIAVF